MKENRYSLLGQLSLERLERDVFRGESADFGSFRIFGGQVLGQALSAASQTVEGRSCHSLHGYFLRPGDLELPIIFKVNRIRDGKCFTKREVTAVQKGQTIFHMLASFQGAEQGVSHQITMPEMPAPEACFSEEQYYSSIGYGGSEYCAVREKLRSIEVRRVEPINLTEPEPRAPVQNLWFKAREVIPDDQAVHQRVLAFISDIGMLGTCSLPHGKSFKSGLQTASLDQAIWFHSPVNMGDWILFSQDSPVSRATRGFNRGSLFSQDGQLVASVVQEGLIREID